VPDVEHLTRIADECNAVITREAEGAEDTLMMLHAVLGAICGRMSAIAGEDYTVQALHDCAKHIGARELAPPPGRYN